jgi:cellulose synthase/poly-beta-1,6-N-acetylglucosamine synthase-like glycosyltransferase
MDQTESVPRTKAFALASAYYSLDFGDDEIVTVFDADTLVAPDLFALAVTGLEEYDIVQAKQTVRNIGDGIIPKLEAMGMAAWSGVVYPRTAKGPYQLLGKGYFLRGRTLKRTRGWQPDEVTEDMAFGVTAYKRGLSLGVLDSYVQDLCPAALGPWVRQKRRWLGGPYRTLGNQPLSRFDQARLVGVTMVNQAVSLTTLLGLPAGIVVFVLVANSGPLSFPLWFTAVLFVNLLNWIAYSLLGYRETFAAITFDSRWQQIEFFLVSNPFTQSVYACLWSIPLLLAARDHVSGVPSVFEVTPKHVGERK